MSASHSPAWRHTKTFPPTTLEHTGNETSLRERRGMDALPSPRPPFSYSHSTANSTNTTPRSAYHDLHASPSSTSLRPPQSPAPSLNPSINSLTPSQAPSFAPSFTPSFAPSTDSRRGLFRRTHRASTSISPPTSISISQTQWQPAMPSTILSGDQQRPPVAHRSVSDSVMPTLQSKPKLQRKKSNASLLYQGLGRGLSRVGSVMRRGANNNTNAAVPSTDSLASTISSPSSSSVASSQAAGIKGRRPPKRCGSTTLQDLCEEAMESAADKDSGARERAIPIQRRSAPLSTYLPPPPPEKSNGVSRPFNVQHDLHVTPELDGLPSEWLESLKSQGVTEHDLLLITSAQRRQRTVTRHPIVRTITPIDTSRPPSPDTPNLTSAASSSPSPVNGESTVSATSSKEAAPPKGLPHAQASTLDRMVSPSPAPSARHPRHPASSQLTVPIVDQPRVRGRGRSSTPKAPPTTHRRSLSAPRERTVTVKRSASLLGKLLDDIDSKSSRPSRQIQRDEPVPALPVEQEEEVSKAGETSSHQASCVDDQLQRRLSDDLRGFHDISIPGEDGWAASILAAWDKDNTLVQSLGPPALARRSTRDGPYRPEAVPTPEPGNLPSSSVPSRSPTPEKACLPRLSKPRSATSLAVPSVDVDDVDDASSVYYIRRRSKSFDQHIVDRSTLYSPPPPPPHPQHTYSDAGDTPPTAFRSPHAGRLRASRDSFGVAHSISTRSSFVAASIASRRSQESRYRRHSDESLDERVQTDESPGTPEPSPSRSSSELNLGTPPTSDLSNRGNVSTAHSNQKDHSLIHERLSVASATESTRCGPMSVPIGPADSRPPSVIPVDCHETRHFSLPSSNHGLIHDQADAQSSVDSPLSTMVHPYSPTEEDFYDQYLGVGWCSACSAAQNQGLGNMPAASGSALGLSLNTPLEHTCTLGLGRHGSVHSQASSYGADRVSVLSVGGASQLSRMSSIASSTHSYNLHEVTLHRAYTRVLRRVPERSETQHSEAPSELGGSAESEADMSADMSGDMSTSAISADNWHSARQSLQSGSSAVSALDEAAWRMAVREGRA